MSKRTNRQTFSCLPGQIREGKQEGESDEVTGERRREKMKGSEEVKGAQRGDYGDVEKRQTGRMEVRRRVRADEPADECWRTCKLSYSNVGGSSLSSV